MKVAEGWSKDPSTKVGAVIVRPDLTVASIGYNGFPRGMSDDPHSTPIVRRSIRGSSMAR
jgi:deoxycytidylate deaminase